jgi:outer membrane biosynthesis protein TonB
MIPVNREILTSVAVVVCLAVCIYMFRELNRAKEDVDQLKNVSTRLMHMSMPQPRPPPPPPPPPVEPVEPVEPEVTEEPVEEPVEIEKKN